MTVLEWVTPPWHYLCLPYQSKRLLFEDGETYSEGCKRCSRPFCEYQYMYSWFLRSPEKTAHYANSYWCLSSETSATCNLTYAPKPFHYDEFWAIPTGNAVTEMRADSDIEFYGETEGNDGSGTSQGWHNWPLRAFQFDRARTWNEKNLPAAPCGVSQAIEG